MERPDFPAGDGAIPGARLLRVSALVAIVAAAYAISGRLSLGLAFAHSSVTPIWPPTGIAVAALLLGGLRLWPGVALGALLANLLNGSGLETAALITVGNTLAPVLAVVMIRVVLRRTTVALGGVADLLAVVGIGGLLCMTVSATLGTASLVVSGALPARLFPAVWPTWWIGDAMGVVLGSPLILVAAATLRAPITISRARRAEGLGVLLVLLVVSIAVFSTQAPVAYLIFPFVLWLSLRLRQLGAALAVLIVASISIFQTVHGNGPFADRDVNAALLGMQAFNGALALSAFLLAVLSRQAASAIDFLEVAVGFLEERVAERTDALVAANTCLSILTRASAELRQSLDPTSVLDRLTFYAGEFALAWGRTVERSTLIYIEQAGELAVVRPAHDGSGQPAAVVTFAPRDQPPLAEAVRTRLPVRATVELAGWVPGTAPGPASAAFSGAIFCPIILDGDVFAVLAVAAAINESDSSDIDNLRALCEIAGLALSSALQHQAALEQALEDSLTGLPNRRAFYRRMSSLPRDPFTILALDIDDLKSVNDRFGHAAGDELIRAVATTIVAEFRPGDLVARTGGDEFLALVAGAAPADGARIAQRVLASLRDVTLASGVPQMSIGCAGGAPGAVAQDVLASADSALYRAKERGKGRVEVVVIPLTSALDHEPKSGPSGLAS